LISEFKPAITTIYANRSHNPKTVIIFILLAKIIHILLYLGVIIMHLPNVKSTYINANEPGAFINFTNQLYALLLNNLIKGYKSVVFICIGTDRSTGDSLGPLIGYKIGNLRYKNVHVYGNLENPVHAKNIEDTVNDIYKNHEKPLIIAIDACLGKMDHIGYVNIGQGSIKPGSGVKKDLRPVGDIFITGIVNCGGFMELLILQNTRLSVVMKMADIISSGIKYVLWKINRQREELIDFYNNNTLPDCLY